jgi:uncharacterized membrane protein YccC
MVLGIALGIYLADLVVAGIGRGIWQILLVVFAVRAAAIALGRSAMFVNQASISALLVVVLVRPNSGFAPSRLIDALVGGAVALAISTLLLPLDPQRAVAEAAEPVVDEAASALDGLAGALDGADEAEARAAIQRLRAVTSDGSSRHSRPHATRRGWRRAGVASVRTSSARPTRPTTCASPCGTCACSAAPRSARAAATGRRRGRWALPCAISAVRSAAWACRSSRMATRTRHALWRCAPRRGRRPSSRSTTT